MANTTSTLAAILADGSIASAFALSIADRHSFLSHDIIRQSYIADLAGRSSTTAEKPVYGYGANLMASETEGTGVSATAISVAALTATVGGFALRRDTSSLAQSIIGMDRLGASALIGNDLAVSATMTLVNSIASVIDDFTNTEADTGVALTLAKVISALATFSANNMRGPIMGVLHSKQWSDLSSNIATTGSGSVQFSDAGAQLAAFTDDSFKGNFLGVDWFTSNQVVFQNGVTDRGGAIFGPDGIVWATATPTVDNPALQTVIGAGQLPVLVDLARDGGAGVSEITARCFIGTSKGLENGVTITSAA